MSRIGREHIPREGGGHHRRQPPLVPGPVRDRHARCAGRSTSSPRPSSSTRRFPAWLLSSLGAFPVDRGNGDRDAMDTARRILERGDFVVIFPEGTRTRPGALGAAQARRRAPRARDRRAGRPGRASSAPRRSAAAGASARTRSACAPAGRCASRASRSPRPQLARAVIERIWPCVELQWEWLGGTRAAAPRRDRRRRRLGHRPRRRARPRRPRGRARLPHRASRPTRSRARASTTTTCRASGCPTPSRVTTAGRARARPRRPRLLRRPRRRAARRRRRARRRDPRAAPASLVLCKGLVAPLGTLPSAYVAERVNARAVACIGGPGHAADALDNGASLVVGSRRRDLRHAARSACCAGAGFDAVEHERRRRRRARRHREERRRAGRRRRRRQRPERRGRRRGQGLRRGRRVRAHAAAADPETFAGLAGAGDLVATVVAEGSRNRRAGELLGQGVSAASIGDELGQSSEALDGVGLLAADAAPRGRAVADARPPRRARRRAHRRRRVHRRT